MGGAGGALEGPCSAARDGGRSLVSEKGHGNCTLFKPCNFLVQCVGERRCSDMTPLEQRRNDVFLRHYVAQEESLRGFVRSLVPTREDAREVMQEVAAVLWKKFEDISSPDDFRRWAFGVARFEALDFLRKRSRDRHCFGDDALQILAEEAEHDAENLDAERQALEQCLAKLPESQRVLVETAYAPGSRIDSLASQTGRSATALYKTLHRIRIALMACTERALAREVLQ